MTPGDVELAMCITAVALKAVAMLVEWWSLQARERSPPSDTRHPRATLHSVAHGAKGSQ